MSHMLNDEKILDFAIRLLNSLYRTNSMYWDRKVSANSADQDQTASEEAV